MTRTTWMLGTVSLMAAALASGGPMRGGMIGVPAVDPEIARVGDAFAAAMNSGDAAAAAAVFAEDGVEMPPDHPAVRGRAAIEQYYRQMFSGPVKVSGFRLAHREAVAAGEVAYMTGDSTITVTPPGAPPMEQSGKYLVVLKRRGGRWQVAEAIHNADAPCPPSPPLARGLAGATGSRLGE
jgi:uncharacterized protein (TIGR02246 family)